MIVTGSHPLFLSPESKQQAPNLNFIFGQNHLTFPLLEIPHLATTHNLRVIAPDMAGYGQTDVDPDNLSLYSYKSVIDDLVAIVNHVTGDANGQIVLGGHDWGGAVAWRFALWYPERLLGVFSVCTPYWPPNPGPIVSKADLVKRLPNFGYQVQFEGRDIERVVVGPARTRAFLSVAYGAKGKDGSEKGGKALFNTSHGVDLDAVEQDQVGESPLLSKEEMDYYVQEFTRQGMKGPTNWYRTLKVNYDEEKDLVKAGKSKITVPSLMVTASRDAALPPAMAEGMGQYFDHLVKKEVNATHWALWEAAAEVNAHISEFVGTIMEGRPLKASI
jgi:pimeloyl-ACP methyl ester carboxylesterase